MNPHRLPNSVDRRLSADWLKSIVRLTRAALLGAVGYCVYFSAVYIAAQVEPSISTSEASWAWGGIVAFAFATSEIFYIDMWGLKASLIRRLTVSGAISIVSLILADPLCALAGIELRRDRAALILPRVTVGLPAFAILAMFFRRWLKSCARGNKSS